MISGEQVQEILVRLEELRGDPIKTFDPNEDIPCLEISDGSRLCRRPKVSVGMITYNHERYIREAIEGVVGQKCSFEFELVIGEDGSSDDTKQICIEYQRRYPNIVRVLHWRANVGTFRNAWRVATRLRGEYVALCEGDDYWTSAEKLQRQVGELEQTPTAGAVYCDFDMLHEATGRRDTAVLKTAGITDRWGSLAADEFIHEMQLTSPFLATATLLCRKHDYQRYLQRETIARKELLLGDMGLRVYLAKQGKPVCIPESMAVYRQVARTKVSKTTVERFFRFEIDVAYMRIASVAGVLSDGRLAQVIAKMMEMIFRASMRYRYSCKTRQSYRRLLKSCREFGLVDERASIAYATITGLPYWLRDCVRRARRVGRMQSAASR